MNPRKFSILVAALALVVSALACGAGEPTLTDARTAKDSEGALPATVFNEFDTIFVVGSLSGIQAGNTIETRWYVENVDGYDPGYYIDSSMLSFDNSNYNTFFFEFPAPSSGWPFGTYKVEIYFNDVLHSTLQYGVQ
jgi:hypothetical protein